MGSCDVPCRVLLHMIAVYPESRTLPSLSLRLKHILEPVTRVKKKKKNPCAHKRPRVFRQIIKASVKTFGTEKTACVSSHLKRLQGCLTHKKQPPPPGPP